MASNFQKKVLQQKSAQKTVAELLGETESNGILDDINSTKTIEETNVIIDISPQAILKKEQKELPRKDRPANKPIKVLNERKLLKKITEPIKGSENWNSRLSEESLEKLEYTTYLQDTTFTELVNRMLLSEKEYQLQHPEIFTTELIKANLKKRRENRGNKLQKAFSLTPETKTFLESGSKKMGMTQTAFLEFIINEYCSQ